MSGLDKPDKSNVADVRPTEKKFVERKQCLEEMKSALASILSLPGAKVAFDEMCLERQGFHFKRQAIASTPRGFVYQAFGMTSVPVVCKVMLLDACSPRVKDNFLKSGARIVRFVGGNGGQGAHPCFIRVYDLFQVQLKTYTFMDEMCGVSMLQLIKGHIEYSQEEVRQWMAALTDAVAFLQARAIAHRRIKMEHVFLERSSAVKLAGWSHSVFFWDAEKGRPLMQSSEPKSFSNCHLPPEAFTGPYEANKADNWSLGVLLVALHTRRHAFKPKSKVNFATQWSAFVEKHRMSAVVKDSLKSVFHMEPEERSSLATFLSSTYFRAPAAHLEQPKHSGRNKSPLPSKISKKGSFSSSKNCKGKSKASATISDGHDDEQVNDIDHLDDEDQQDEPFTKSSDAPVKGSSSGTTSPSKEDTKN